MTIGVAPSVIDSIMSSGGGAGAGSTFGMGALGGPWGLAASGAISLAELLANHYIGQGRKTANTMTQGKGPQAVLDQKLTEIEQLAHTDPQAAEQQLTQAWDTFYKTTQQWIAQGGNKAIVAKQALSTKALIQTVDTLASQLGIPNLRQQSAAGTLQVPPPATPSAPVSAPPQDAPSPLGGDPAGPAGPSLSQVSRPQPGTFSPYSPSMINANQPMDERVPGGGHFPGPWNPPMSLPPAAGGPTQQGTTGPGNWLTRALLPIGLSAGLNAISAGMTSGAAKDASQLQYNAAMTALGNTNQVTNRALDLLTSQYGNAQKTLQPWINLGQGAAGMLGRGIGLPGAPPPTTFAQYLQPASLSQVASPVAA